jgi:non-ribosomal peptide synthetase component F
MFIFQNAAIPPIELPGLTISPQNIDGGTSKFDLKLSLWETSDELAGSLEYKTDLFDATTIMAMANQLDCLLRQVTTQPNLTLNELAHQLAKDFDALTPESVRQFLLCKLLRFYHDPSSRASKVWEPPKSSASRH